MRVSSLLFSLFAKCMCMGTFIYGQRVVHIRYDVRSPCIVAANWVEATPTSNSAWWCRTQRSCRHRETARNRYEGSCERERNREHCESTCGGPACESSSASQHVHGLFAWKCKQQNIIGKPQVHQGVLICLQYNSQSMTMRLPIMHGPFQHCTECGSDTSLDVKFPCSVPPTTLLHLAVRSTNIAISKLSGRACHNAPQSALSNAFDRSKAQELLILWGFATKVGLT